ncbi:MAG: monofunctional biosynthetic peptidoglycan transglycosylase [Pseudomonadota bacterium]
MSSNASAKPGRKKKPTTKKADRRSLPIQLLRGAARVILGALIIVVLWVFIYRVVPPPGGIYMASEAWRLGGIEREWRSLDEISPRLARSVIAAEDARFCDHYGFDLEAIREAIEANRAGKRVYGASTISQQVAKNVFLWHQRSWVRKGLEAGFTVLIELLWPKRRILEIYLNTAEFDEGVFGAEAAAQAAFNRPALALTRTQAARMAAVLPNPKGRSAATPSGSTRRRAARIADGAETIDAQGRDSCVF